MKRWSYAAFFLIIITSLTGCKVQGITEKKTNETEFEIVEEERIPEDMKAWIDRHKEKPFQTAVSDQGYWYVARGYGKKDRMGYEIIPDRCYETKHTIAVHTLLYGPEEEKDFIEGCSYPYLVIRMKWKDKMIVFLNK